MSKHYIYKKLAGFTLIEMLLAMTGFLVLLGVIFGLYRWLLWMKTTLSTRQSLIEQSYYTLERLQILLKDFTIDYEEYRNRSTVWCNTPSQQRDVGMQWYCGLFTYYGNTNSIIGEDPTQHQRYYCSNKDSQTIPLMIQTNFAVDPWCFQIAYFTSPYYQSFGQYKQLFRNMWSDVDKVPGAIGDADDEDRGIWPIAIGGTWIQELYLISPDKTQRLYIRRALVDSGDFNGDTVLSGDSEYRYTLQILRLQWLDIGKAHDADITDPTVYDGIVDTRVCDADQWFICTGDSPGGIYSWFNLPADANDGRVNLLDESVTVADRSLQIYPTADPEYARADQTMLINPYITIFMNMKLYAGAWQNTIVQSNIEDFSFPIQTTFNIKTRYVK